MNILVIGNGFDLAHALPTLYQDFLTFTDNYTNFLEDISEEVLSEIRDTINDNKWIRHFKRFYDCNGWIGFEKEISKVIKIMDEKVSEFEKIKKRGVGGVKFIQIEQEALKDFDSIVNQGIIYDANIIFKIRDCMLNDLNRLIRCLEIYLDCYINHLSVNRISPDIKNLDIDKVLSFNYTDTYERIYDIYPKNNIEYDYIHGKADINNTIETNSMVLGIDEYLEKEERNKRIEFIAFKKYYQRIYKEAGCKYRDWLDGIEKENNLYMEKKHDCEMSLKNIRGSIDKIEETKAELEQLRKNPPKHNLYIFGHSLDITDKDYK